jgi:hypothetical protein
MCVCVCEWLIDRFDLLNVAYSVAQVKNRMEWVHDSVVYLN